MKVTFEPQPEGEETVNHTSVESVLRQREWQMLRF